MDSPESFQATLEADMKILAAEVRRREDSNTERNMEGVQAVKEALRAFPHLNPEQPGVNGTPSAPATHGDASSPLPAYAQSAAPEVKLEIEYLLDIALTKGIGPALAASEKSPYFVQDAFHDALAGRLYPELQKRGVVK